MPKIYLKSYGCSANTADAEIARGALTENGHTLVETPDDADINIIVTCVVKTPTEQKVSKELRELEASGKPLIVAGCMPKSMTKEVKQLVPTASLVGPDDIERIPEAVNYTLNGEQVTYIDGEATDRTCLPRVRENNLVHIAPISTGCLGNCSYCIVKFARGHLYSFPAEKIVQDARSAIADGCREIWVTAEDTATYDDNGTRLPELLNMITAIDGDFRVRVGMTTPNQIEPVLDDMIESLKNPKLYKFIHIPIQSGNDKILEKMRRRYTVQGIQRRSKQTQRKLPRHRNKHRHHLRLPRRNNGTVPRLTRPNHLAQTRRAQHQPVLGTPRNRRKQDARKTPWQGYQGTLKDNDQTLERDCSRCRTEMDRLGRRDSIDGAW